MDVIEKLLSKVKVNDAGCFEWQCCRHEKGYGLWFRPDSTGRVRKEYAHRISWSVFRGPIPAGLLVCHHCDNPPCINPAHLFLGTIIDNNLDALRKGRMRRGSRNGMARLTEEDVMRYRELRASGVSQRVAEKLLGIGHGYGSQIDLRKVWKHV